MKKYIIGAIIGLIIGSISMTIYFNIKQVKCDVNRDGKVTLVDAVIVLNEYLRSK